MLYNVEMLTYAAIQTILSGYLLKDLKLDSTNLLSQMAPVALVLLTPFAMVSRGLVRYVA